VVPPFKSKAIKIELPGAPKVEEVKEEATPEDEEVLSELLQQLNVTDLGISSKDIQAAEFEKDDDSNFHIDFIYASSNLRARNYTIPESTHQKTKMIAGKIIPAIATTTAMITGAVTSEIYKFVQGFDTIEAYKNGFINLALPLFVFSEPTEVNKTKSKDFDPIMGCPVKAIPENYTIYDKLVVQGPMTFQQFFDHMKERCNIDITLVSCGKIALFNSYLPGNKHGPRKVREMAEVYREIATDDPIPDTRYYLCIELGGEVIGEGCDFTIPTVKYIFKPQQH
jgi:ubiquitin-activating enzyme E1